jgi:hypothetical protein
MHRKKSNFYIENVQDGVIFFYQDYSILKHILQKEIKKDYQTLDLKPLLSQPFFSRMIYSKTDFNQVNFEFTYQIIRGPATEIIDLVKFHFLQFDPTLEFSPMLGENQKGVIVRVKSYDLIYNYTKYLIKKYIIDI